MFVSGPTLACLRCGSPDLRLVSEHLDRIDQIYVATVVCRTCKGTMLDSRRATQLRPYTQKGPLPDGQDRP